MSDALAQTAKEWREERERSDPLHRAKPNGGDAPWMDASADHDAFELIRSYAVSAREAADRGDREEVRLRLRLQLRDAFRYAVELHKLLSPAPAEGGRK